MPDKVRTRSSNFTFAAVLLVSPEIAYGQHIPLVIVAMALSPLLVTLLAVILGAISRSWNVGLAHVGLVALWVLLFGVASYWVENDYVIWTPIVLYGVHAVTMIALIAARAVRWRRS